MDTAKIAKNADKTLTKHGKNVVVTTYTTSTVYDPTTGASVVTGVNQTIKGLTFEWGGSNYPNNGQGAIDWTLIRDGDQKLMLSPFDTSGNNTILPKVGDIATVFGRAYTITEPIKPLHPDGTLLLIECNIRGSA